MLASLMRNPEYSQNRHELTEYLGKLPAGIARVQRVPAGYYASVRFPGCQAWTLLFITAWLAPTVHGQIQSIDLDGAWTLRQSGQQQQIAADVPGCVHTDLLAAGRIPDPFFRDNERQVQWVSQADWVYRRRFDVPADFLRRRFVRLHCQGLDTIAGIRLNDVEIGRADNMFRTWDFDAKPALRVGSNSIEITFASPTKYLERMRAANPVPQTDDQLVDGTGWIRKAPYMFGWDWGPKLATCGIWRPISIEAFDTARLADVMILQDHRHRGAVKLTVNIQTEPQSDSLLSASVRVVFNGQPVSQQDGVDIAQNHGAASLTIANPQLWWPNGMGEHPLYDVIVELRDSSGNILDKADKRIGLRTIEFLKANEKRPVQFAVNGVSFFVKGGDWIPADSFPTRLTPQKLRRYIADAVAANMNMLRLWGGGYYEDDSMLDACDEMGILTWMDLKFACNPYPSFDQRWSDTVRAELRDNIRRLRHHPCIAIWSGNNEVIYNTAERWDGFHMSRQDYDLFFKGAVAEEVHQLDPQTPYVPGSPESGDEHYWGVWHGNKPFKSFDSVHGFMTEFGMQSFPQPRTVDGFTDPSDRDSALSPIMIFHQRSGGLKGNQKILDYIARDFRPPRDFDSMLWLSQIMQGYGIKYGAEHWRREMPRSTGVVIWQFNDCWPGPTWSAVDYLGRWKALHYMTRRFFAPVLISGLSDAKTGAMTLYVTSDRMTDAAGVLSWHITDTTGQELVNGSITIQIPSRTSAIATTLQLGEKLRDAGAANLLAWIDLQIDGQMVSSNLLFFVRPGELNLVDPKLTAEVRGTRDIFDVTLHAEHPALWVWIELEGADATYSDNFLNVRADTPVRIQVRPAIPMSLSEFKTKLRVRSLMDLYAAGPATR